MKPSIEIATAPASVGVNPYFKLDHYLQLIDQLYPRVVTQIDRDPQSPTFGACDRHHWMYRMHDINSGVLQQTSLSCAALSLYFSNTSAGANDMRNLDGHDMRNFKANSAEYCGQIALAINNFTLKDLSRGRGAIDEYYPGERSFPATVFAAYALLKSASLLAQEDVLASPVLLQTARFIAERGVSPAANQDVAGAAYLFLFLKVSADRLQLPSVEKKQMYEAARKLVLGRGDDFAYTEYGGFDVGYATVTLNYLAYIVADGESLAKEALLSLAHKISYFVTPSGQLGGEYASRSTTYFLPFGLLYASQLDGALAEHFGKLDLVSMFAKLDDRYLMHYCLPSLVMATQFLSLNKNMSVAASSSKNPATYTEASATTQLGQSYRMMSDKKLGVFALQSKGSSLYVGLNKGGTFHYECGEQIKIDCGYRAVRDGLVYSTNVLSDASEVTVDANKEFVTITIQSHYERYKQLVPSPLKTVILRLFLLLGPLFNRVFKMLLINKSWSLPGVIFHRNIRIDFLTQSITIDDKTEGLLNTDHLLKSVASSFRVVPSARFYYPGEEANLLAAEAEMVAPKTQQILKLDIAGAL